MAVRIDLTLDCADATRLAAFWKLALGYQDEPPPAPFATRQEWLDRVDPGASADDGAWLRDPDGAGPRLSLLRVPEPKRAKNRLHMDLRVAGTGSAEERWTRITEEVERLAAAGATVLQPFPGHHVVLADPEGNEFCVC
jgi:Glyoxalase-like domain